MKVIHYIPSIDKSTGGTAFYLQELAKSLGEQVALHILTAFSDNPVELGNATIHWIDLSIKQIHRIKQEARKVFEQLQPDLLHANTIWMPQNHFVQEAAHELGIPVVLTPHGMLEPWIMVRNPWKKKLAMALYQRRDLQKAALLHATCEAEKQHIRELGFRNEIVVIPNGLDLSRVPEAKQDYGTRKVVFLSRIHPKKGIELLLQAWKQLDTKDWTLEIAGDGEASYVEQLREQIKKEQLANVKLVGPQYGDAKWNFLKSADLFVLPTYSENFGIVVAEALAVGVPVITTTGTPWQELETQNCGWWIELSVENLATAIGAATALNNKQLQTMGKNGRQLVNTKYDIRAVAMELNRIYHQLLY